MASSGEFGHDSLEQQRSLMRKAFEVKRPVGSLGTGTSLSNASAGVSFSSGVSFFHLVVDTALASSSMRHACSHDEFVVIQSL